MNACVSTRKNGCTEQVQQSVEGINFLDSGYSILATAEEGVVLAAGVWDRDDTEETTTVRSDTCGVKACDKQRVVVRREATPVYIIACTCHERRSSDKTKMAKGNMRLFQRG